MMAKTKSMIGNQNHDDDDALSSSSTRKRSKTLDDSCAVSWSDLNHDLLFKVMMLLGVFDFLAFSGVCKTWRSFALFNKNKFMASRPPMSVCNSMKKAENDCCSLEDFEKRKFNITLPHFTGRICVGSTCGYLVLFGRKTRDFWLVNPITRDELHFPNYPVYVGRSLKKLRMILVFSPSTSGWVFVVLYRNISPYGVDKRKLSFYIAGKQGWNHVSSSLPINDLHVFKGKLYTLHTGCALFELRFSVRGKRKWTLSEIKNFSNQYSYATKFVSTGENLYVIYNSSPLEVLELDFGEMKWVSPEKTIGDYAVFVSLFKSSVAIKPESWVGLQTQYKTYGYLRATDESPQCKLYYYKTLWYVPYNCYDCLNVNLLDE